MFEEGVRARISFAPPENWVKDATFVRPEKPSPSRVQWGLYTWMIDDQIWLAPDYPHRYSRSIEEVVNLSALDYLANITLPFNPYHDRLCIHHIRILRGAEVIEVDVASRYFVMRRERQFERLVLSGLWTFAVTLPDVRVGDIVDLAFTVSGDPECFKGEVSLPMPLQGGLWWHYRRARLLIPQGRDFYLSPFPAGWIEPVVTPQLDGTNEILFEGQQVPPATYEADMPGWVRPMRGFILSSLKTWADVADIMRAGFEGDTDYPQGLLEVIEAIRTEWPDVRDQVTAVVRWVQENIRYFAFSLGDGGFVPRSLRQIFDDRIGDCKDVSKMISAMLTRLGIEACPALVDTRAGADLPNQPPRLGAFNHCITLCRMADRNYWFEGTLNVAAGGDLDHMAQADHGYALPLRPGSDLVQMRDAPPRLDYEVTEYIRLPAAKGEMTEMQIDYTYRGAAADSVRTELRYRSLNDYIEDRCALFTYIYGLNMCAIPQLEDDRKNNEITIKTFVTTPDPWQGTGVPGEKVCISPESAFGWVIDPPQGKRRFPYALGDVREGRLTTIIETDFDVRLPKKPRTWTFGGLELTFSGRATLKGYEATRTYRVSRSWLSSQEKEQLDRAYNDIMGYDRLFIAVAGLKPLSWVKMLKWRAVIWGGLVILGAVVIWLITRQGVLTGL